MEFLDDSYFRNFNPVCHIGGYFSIGEGERWSLDKEKFAQNKFYYIKSGRCEVCIEGVKYEGKEGRWFFIPSGASHTYKNDESIPFSKYWMHFDLYPTTVNFFSTLNLPYYIDVTDAQAKEKVDRIFSEFSEAIYGNKIQDKLREKICLIELFETYITLASKAKEHIPLSKQNARLMKNVTKYIEDNIEKNFSIKELADYCHLHPNYLIRAFKERIGITPAKYVRMLKLETAKMLLEETNLSVTEVMTRVGFDDAAHFSKLFKSQYGASPKKWKNQVYMMVKYFYKD